MGKRKTPTPVIKPTEFDSIEQIDRGIRKFRRLIGKVNALDPKAIRYDDQEIDNVEADMHNTLMDVFGLMSPMFQKLQHPHIWHGGHNTGDTEYDRQDKFAAGIPQTVKKLEGLITHLEEQKEDFILPEPERPEPQPSKPSASHVSIHGNVKNLSLGDLTEQNISAVVILNVMADAIEQSTDIPEAEKKSLLQKIRGLATNPYVVNLGSHALIELLKGL